MAVQLPLSAEQLVTIGGTLESILAGNIVPIRRCGQWRHQYIEVSDTKRKRQPRPVYASDVTSHMSTKSAPAKKKLKKAKVVQSVEVSEATGCYNFDSIYIFKAVLLCCNELPSSKMWWLGSKRTSKRQRRRRGKF